MPPLRTRSKFHFTSVMLLAILFVAAGVNHFLNEPVYARVMPPYFVWPTLWIYLSGFFEVLGGVGLMLPRWRRIAGWGLIALLIAVFPVHVHMLDRADQFAFIPYWILIVRLPLQGLLVAWIWWTSLQHDWK